MDDSPGGPALDDECANCGAMLPPADAEGHRTCTYCGVTIDITPPTAQPPPVAPTIVVATGSVDDLSSVRTGATSKGRTGCALWAVIAFVALMTIVPIGAVFLAEDAFDDLGDAVSGGGGDGIDLSISGEAALVLPSEPTDPPAVVALSYHYDRDLEESVHEVALFDGEDEPRWRGPALSESQYQVPLLSDGSRIFTVDQDEVQALSSADGSVVWRGSLTDDFSWTCEHCFSLLDDRLLATGGDAVLVAFDTATGQQAWTRRFEDTRAPTYVVGDRVLVIDGAGSPARGIVLSPADGTELTSFESTCQRPDGYGSSEGLDVDSVVLPQPDGTVVLGFGTWPGCWERRDLATGAVLWQTALPEVSFSWSLATASDATTLLAQDGDGGLVVIDLATGALRPIPAPQDAELWPLAVTGPAHLALARTTRGSEEWSVLGLDPSTGAQRWSWSLGDARPAVDTFGASTLVSSNEQQVALHADAGGLDLVTLDGETSDLAVERLDLATGVPGERRAIDQPEYVGALRFVPLGWSGRQAVLLVGDTILVVDLDTGTVRNRYGG